LEIAPASTAVGSATVEGSVRLHLPQGLPHAEALAEILSREGIPYFRFAAPDGKSPHLGPAELTPLIERIVTVLEWPRPDRLQPLVDELLALVGRAMAGVGLPLFRLWYFPADGRTIRRSAFSPRFDVDRAIQLVPRIYDMERATGAESTYYLRAFGPYYDERAIADLARSCNGIDLALHGEFATNAPRFGGVTPAAREEKGLLESMIGRPIRGVSMHGGDLAYNSGPESQAAVAAAGFGYDTTSGPWPPALPIRTVVGGKLQPVHVLAHSLIDVHTIPFHWQRITDGDRVLRVIRWRDIGRQLVSSSFWRYESRLLAQALAGLEQARASNTVFVPAFHPVYFGAASYLARLPSWGPNLVRHRRVARSGTEHDGNR
ncbi:MAG: hypothetical protein R3190_13350, partial [Thermoanaerobaculia bacterium]|nr:hypothetical protein [Thermoanaerobaculia bacterium]